MLNHPCTRLINGLPTLLLKNGGCLLCRVFFSSSLLARCVCVLIARFVCHVVPRSSFSGASRECLKRSGRTTDSVFVGGGTRRGGAVIWGGVVSRSGVKPGYYDGRGVARVWAHEREVGC